MITVVFIKKLNMNQDQGRSIARVLSTVLGKLVVANDTRAQQTGEAPPITKFHALRAPSISIYDYVERIFKYAACSSECFVLALIYVDRIIQRQGFVINSLNVHRVVITSIMLAAKFFDDHYFKNGFYAKVGGVPCNEMNSLEVEFLFLLNFSLHVPPETYKKYYVELCNHAQTLPSVEKCEFSRLFFFSFFFPQRMRCFSFPSVDLLYLKSSICKSTKKKKTHEQGLTVCLSLFCCMLF